MKKNSLNLNLLLSSKDSINTLIAIDNYLHNLLSQDGSLNNLTEPQRNFFFIQELEREVNNGGFNQYFFNSSGEYAHETISALKAIGADSTMELLQSAINEFPSQLVPRKTRERRELLQSIESKAKNTWDGLDAEFYKCREDLDSLNIAYIKENREQFEAEEAHNISFKK